ncbi:hypothetical protein RHMOL_Rhmol05G0112000 [Rhododendron molle]|uniref:Uncharacterized protein n=2 Tax=Rhododendron molle TaxID=49168 RepID=A0ACC0NN37_RHOML|nr:hypothetical protein RHMOL_Rhmol05G0112000 [Rhododendron molle]KAI8554620.1 hypothetical protein RHMOL_Rhmol05G0112000 [Rhododendron molle]
MSNNNDAVGVLRTIRDAQPAHYLFKIESFSILSEEKIEKYESDDFEVGGYKWGLCFYPNGNKKRNGDGHISLYLVIRDTDELPPGWEVNVQFKFFVFDHVRDKYLTVQDADCRTRRYHQMRTEWGISKLISLDTFKKSTNGYLLDDSCVLGVEVFVTKYAGKGECLSMIKEPRGNTYTWKVDNFSAISMQYLRSEEFNIGGRNWKLVLYPKGDAEAKGRSLSLYLSVADCEKLPLNWKKYARFKLRVRNQVGGVHQERQGDLYICALSNAR